MEKIYLDSRGIRTQHINVQTIGSSLAARAMDSLIAAQPGFGTVHDGGNVVLIIGESGLNIARKLRMRVTRKHPEHFVLIGDGTPIDFALVRDMPISAFVGADESLEVLLEAIEAASRGTAFCSPQMVPTLVEYTKTAPPLDKPAGDSGSANTLGITAEYCGPSSLRVSAASAAGNLAQNEANVSAHFDGVGHHVERANRLAHALGLTDREWDVAALAVEGLANAEIADLLAMSVPTVKFNLYRAYQKLGIRRRSQIANALMIMPVGSLMFAADRKRAAMQPSSRFASLAVTM